MALALIAAGCLQDAPQVTPPPTPTPEPEPTPTVTVYDLETRVWYAGMVVTLHDATATLDQEGGGSVVLEVTIQNPGDAEAELGGPIRLTGGAQGLEPTRETELPAVPAASEATATVTWDILPGFDVPGAVVRIGRSDEHQAIVPLVPGTQELVTLEPLAGDIRGTGLAGELFVDLEGYELRADLPDWDLELARDTMALTVTYGATFRGDFVGGMSFTAENVALRLADGTVVQPRRDGRSLVLAILRPDKRNHLTTRFEVPAPGLGAYHLMIAAGQATKEIPFEVAAP